MGAMDKVKGGLSIRGGQLIATALVEAGVNAIDASAGIASPGSPEPTGQGFYIPLAEGIGRAVTVPVIGVGGITEPAFADEVIRERRVDIVAIGKATLNDPEWARKAVEALSRAGNS